MFKKCQNIIKKSKPEATKHFGFFANTGLYTCSKQVFCFISEDTQKFNKLWSSSVRFYVPFYSEQQIQTAFFG